MVGWHMPEEEEESEEEGGRGSALIQGHGAGKELEEEERLERSRPLAADQSSSSPPARICSPPGRRSARCVWLPDQATCTPHTRPDRKPNPASPYVWTVLGGVFFASLVYYLKNRTR